MQECSPNLSALATALISNGRATIHISGAKDGMLVSVGVEDAYGSGVIQRWEEAAPLANKLIDRFVLDFMRDVYEPGHPVVELVPVTAEYYAVSWCNRTVEAELMTLAVQVKAAPVLEAIGG